MVKDKFIVEGEQLVNKYNKFLKATEQYVLESEKENFYVSAPTHEEWSQVQMAKILENSETTLNEYYKKILEATGTQLSDVAQKNQYFSLTSLVYGTFVTNEIASIQALNYRKGTGFYIRSIFDTTKGEITKGDLANTVWKRGPAKDKINGFINYSAETVATPATAGATSVTVNTLPIVPGSVKFVDDGKTYVDDGEGNIVELGTQTANGTVNYATGAISGFAALADDTAIITKYDMTTSPVNAPVIKADLAQIDLEARNRKLKAVFSFDAAQDLSKVHNVDIQKLMQDISGDEIKAEVDAETLAIGYAVNTDLSVTFNMTPSKYYAPKDHYESFAITIAEATTAMFNATRKYRPNVLVLGANGQTIVSQMSGFKPVNTVSQGPAVIGTINGNIKVIADPYLDADAGYFTYKNPSNPFASSMIHAPYYGVLSTQFILGADFEGSQGYAMAYDTVAVPEPDMFVRLAITHVPSV